MGNKDRVEIAKGYFKDTSREAEFIQLIDWLVEQTDFFTCPASTKFHNNFEGGLFTHSKNVVNYALLLNTVTAKNSNSFQKQDEDSVKLCSFFHDVCKANCYHEEMLWTKDPSQRHWIKYKGYKFEDQLPLGHGEKSLYIVSQFVHLKPEEALAIRFHMGFCIQEAHIQYPHGGSMEAATQLTPLVRLIQCADLCSSLAEVTIDYKEQAIADFMKGKG